MEDDEATSMAAETSIDQDATNHPDVATTKVETMTMDAIEVSTAALVLGRPDMVVTTRALIAAEVLVLMDARGAMRSPSFHEDMAPMYQMCRSSLSQMSIVTLLLGSRERSAIKA